MSEVEVIEKIKEIKNISSLSFSLIPSHFFTNRDELIKFSYLLDIIAKTAYFSFAP